MSSLPPSKKRTRSEPSTRKSTTRTDGDDGDPQQSHMRRHDDDDDATSNNSMVPSGVLPAYLAEAFGELYEEDGLICLGRGLQWLMLLAAFCRFYVDVEHGHAAVVEEPSFDSIRRRNNNNNNKKKAPLVLVLGLKDETERSTLIQILQSWGTPVSMLPTMITNESGLASDRAALYQQGGVFAITSRILIVDLLTGTIPSADIDGMLIAHGENVTDQSTEAFIVRIYQSRQQQQHAEPGFVKAFSEAPDALTAGFAQIDKILKALHVRKLYLYPRFHSSVRDELEQPPSNNNNNNHNNHGNIVVTELQQPLSKQQKEIQNAIAVLVMQCLRQLKQSTEHLVSWTSSSSNNATSNNNNDGQPISVENCVTQHFDLAISRQLEPFWHRLTPAVKQLVQDLRTLRTLFHALLQYDCVSFWKLLNSLRTMSAASRYPAMWLLETAADTLFRKAKERVYQIYQPPPTPQVPNPVAQLVAVLEENPKWKLLKQVLNEIRNLDAKQANNERRTGCGVTHILVMVKDDKTLDTLKSVLTDNGGDGDNGRISKTLQLRWLRYLEQCNDRSRSITDVRGNTSTISEESRLLLEEEGRARRILYGRNHNPTPPSLHPEKQTLLNHVPQHLRKRRRVAAEQGRGEKNQEDLDRQAVLQDAVELTEHEIQETYQAQKKMVANADESDDDDRFQVSFPDNELRVILQSYSSVSGDQSHLFLQDIQPQYVVLYDADVAFIRAIEIYAAVTAQNKSIPVAVYFLVFEASAEEKNFKTALEREQNAFERLIHHKKTMPPPALQSMETQEMQQAMHHGAVAGTYCDGSFPLAVDTRSGKKKTQQRRDIAVDVREFRSALPNILHQGGMRLAPVTLIVGDFVLSSVHCVERKSISDLFGSFSSGRLYAQAEAMSKYYKVPCLLIEFDPNKSFCLQNSNELGTEIRMDSICSKMALLTMHFPRLRILWSRSPHETLKIFRDLKANHEEVDVERAMEIGRNESEEFLLRQSGEEDEINEAARDMLLRLPGVNVQVARRIMQECDSLAELCEMSREDLRRIAGPVAGQKLFTFFRQKLAST